MSCSCCRRRRASSLRFLKLLREVAVLPRRESWVGSFDQSSFAAARVYGGRVGVSLSSLTDWT